jgi:hypothetical protein
LQQKELVRTKNEPQGRLILRTVHGKRGFPCDLSTLWICFGVLYSCCITQREYLLSINIKDMFRACQTGEPWICLICVSTAKSSGARARGVKAVAAFVFTSTPLACEYSLLKKFFEWQTFFLVAFAFRWLIIWNVGFLIQSDVWVDWLFPCLREFSILD